MKNKVIRIITTLFAIMLTADLGRISFNGHDETYYNLPMHKEKKYGRRLYMDRERRRK